ncbi:hypothetical protein FRC07_003694 [Ceratobasidium sp. 392]|nr:hypothetical protein FRC07_003694 [Ceratobasidium sp. 392]
MDLNSILSDNSFPALRELTLDRASIFQALSVMRAEQLVGRLTALRLGIEDEDFGFNNIYGIWEIEDYQFPQLFENIPRLNHLEVTVYEPDVLFPFNQYVLWPLLELPLIKSMVLRGICLEDVQMVTEELEVAWPDLSELRVPNSAALLYDLSELLVILNLHYLELQLELRNPEKCYPYRKFSPVTSLEVIRSSAGGHMCLSPEEMDLAACTLLSFWPELKQIEWDTTDTSTLDLVKQLNDTLAVI